MTESGSASFVVGTAGHIDHGKSALVKALTQIDPDRLERMWAMTPAQRRQAAQRGQLSLSEMLNWASRRPHEVPIVNGE